MTPPEILPDFAVIVPHYNDTRRLARCLDALMPQVGSDTEVVVADNASTEDLAPIIRAHPTARFVTEPQQGAANARNRGVTETTAPAFAFLDADCVPRADWLVAARTAVTKGTVTGGRVEVFDETPPPRSGAEAFEQVFAFHQRDYIIRKGFSVTANLVTTRAVFEATGPLINGVSEDVDWCRRAVARGAHLVYNDGLVVGHPSRQDWAAITKKWRRLTKEMYALNGHKGTARAKWALRGLAMGPSALIHAPRMLRHPGLGLGERSRGMATLFALRLQRGAWMLRQALTDQP